MSKGIYIVGTDTDVGKTVISAAIMYILRKAGYNAAYFKPALSGAFREGEKLIPGDTRFVCKVSDFKEEYNNITPYVYENAVSPHLASKMEKKPISIEKIKEKLNDLKEKYPYIVAEGSGGVACPIIDDEKGIYYLHQLIKELGMSVILVCKAALGTINHTILTVEYLKSLDIKIKGIIVNGYEDNFMQRDNLNIIKKSTNLPILAVVNKLVDVNVDKLYYGNLKEEAEKSIEAKEILNTMDEF